MVIELTGVPFRQFDVTCPRPLARLEAEGESLISLPAKPGNVIEGRYNYYQTFHGRKLAQGYVTNLALTPRLGIQTLSADDLLLHYFGRENSMFSFVAYAEEDPAAPDRRAKGSPRWSRGLPLQRCWR